MTAVDVFAGYLVLDAWVANQDRHDRNWAVLERTDAPAPRRLAASYDNTSSLGFNLQDDRRRNTLAVAGGIDRWARRGRADQFEHDPANRSGVWSLVRLAREALERTGPTAREHWTSRLAAVDRDVVESLITRLPGLSDLTATFILELLTTNRRRLLDDDR